MDIYVANEKYDGYLRDGCVFRNDVNMTQQGCPSFQQPTG